MNDQDEPLGMPFHFEYDLNALIKAAATGDASLPLVTDTMTFEFKLEKRIPLEEAWETIRAAVADLGAALEVTPSAIRDIDSGATSPGYHLLFTGDFGEIEIEFSTDSPGMNMQECRLIIVQVRAMLEWLNSMESGDSNESE